MNNFDGLLDDALLSPCVPVQLVKDVHLSLLVLAESTEVLDASLLHYPDGWIS